MTTKDTLQEQANAIRLLRQDRDKLRQELAQEKEASARELNILRQTVIRIRNEAQSRFEELAAAKQELADCRREKDELIAKLVKATGRLEGQRDELLAVCQEIASDSGVDLVYSERRLRLYAAITKAGGIL